MDARLSPVSFEELRGWSGDNHIAAFAAFLASSQRMAVKPYKTRALGVSGRALASVATKALNLKNPDADAARLFFEQNFVPHRIGTEETTKTGFLTGFFEPVVSASLKPSRQFPYPLYRRPNDLIDINDANRPATMDPSFRYGRQTLSGPQEYFDRPAIQAGALDGKELELVWLQSKVDAFFIHVQGSAKLQLAEGGWMRVTYAAKSGHPYTSIGKVLCEQTGVQPEQMTADRLAQWMYDHPDRIDGLLSHNKSYIFFEEIEGLDPSLGPIAAAKTPLMAGRSLAVDRTLHTFGSPVWVTTRSPLPGDDSTLARLMVAQDTGSAIVGPVRGDIFVGSGVEAGMIAGKVRHQAEMQVLVAKDGGL